MARFHSPKIAILSAFALAAACAEKPETGAVTISASYLIEGFSAEAVSVVSGGVIPDKGQTAPDAFAFVEFYGFGSSSTPVLLCKRAGHLFYYDLSGAPKSGDLYDWMVSGGRGAITLDGESEWLKAALHSSDVTFTHTTSLGSLEAALLAHLVAPRYQIGRALSSSEGILPVNFMRKIGGKNNIAPKYLKACTA